MARLKELDARALTWLRESVMPLWTTAGFDSSAGLFEESLRVDGSPAGEPRRAMVQARQIYSLKTAAELGVVDAALARSLCERAAQSLLERYRLSSCAFMHSLNVNGSVASARPDLYTQAFAIFGMACAHSFVGGDSRFREAALGVVSYLRRERAVSLSRVAGDLGAGVTEQDASSGLGFTELSASGSGASSSDEGLLYASNPHMHLFEAALEWMEFDRDPVWSEFAGEIAELALSRFIDPYGSGFLAEHFTKDWSIRREAGGRFMFEPGHQFEWAWLFKRYEKLSGRSLGETPSALYDGGLDGVASGVALDEIWSDGTVKLATARFWPQAERAKAASLKRDVDGACDAMSALFAYLETPRVGLWTDTRLPDGSMKSGNAKGSSLYHIIGAISEVHKLARSMQ